MESRFRAEIRLLLACVERSGLGRQAAVEVPEAVDWERLLDLASWHRVSGFVCKSLRGSRERVPDRILERLERRLSLAADLAHKQRSELAMIVRAFEAEGIQTILLKGAALIRTVYDSPELRPMGDLDLLVPESRLVDAESVVRGLGYDFRDQQEVRAFDRETARHSPRLTSADGWCDVELHRHIVAANSTLHFDVAELWANARCAKTEQPRECVLGSEDQLIHLCVHFFLDRRLFYQSYSALGQLCDIGRVIEGYPGGISWGRLLESVQRRKCEKPVACALMAVRRLLRVEIPDEVLEPLRSEDPSGRRVDLFIQRRVLDRRPWFFHQLVTPEDNSSLNILRSAIRRVLFDRRYLQEKYGRLDGPPGNGVLLLRHAIDLSLVCVRYLLSPSDLPQDLRVDRWMHLLEQPDEERTTQGS